MFNRISHLWFVLLGLISSCGQRTSHVDERSVTAIPSPAKSPSAEPYLFSDNGVIYLSWLEHGDSITAFKYSILNDSMWSEPKTIAAGSRWFVNWADYPAIAANGESLVAHFLESSGPGKYSYDIKYLLGTRGSWNAPQLLNEDGKEAEHGFVSIIPFGENFFMSWLDGRNTAMEGMGHDQHHGTMTLRAAVVDKSGKKLEEWQLDDRVCDCCQTSAALTDNGPAVVYRDRSEDEIRDISIVRLQNGKWTTPKTMFNDGWKINGCPVNGPRISAMGNHVAVAWYSSPGDSTQVKVVFSHDGGEQFSQPVLLSRIKTTGRVDVELIDSKTAFVSWIENDSIQVARVSDDRIWRLAPIAEVLDSRSSGFPQMTLSGNKLVFAWTDASTESVRTASIEVSKSKRY